MIQTFDRDGIRFQYPGTWTVEEEEGDARWTVSVTSPETAFVVVSLRPEAHDPADLADQTLDAIKTEYKELDSENAVETVAGMLSIGHDIDFLTLDTAITCRTRCFDTPGGPLLVMTQVSEYDRAANEPVLKAIVASLRIDQE
jgi:hypothetical protein